jgi:hypothetical protein
MCKRIVLVTALLVAACGTGTSEQASPNQEPSDLGGGTIGVGALLSDTTLVKVVVKTTQLVDVAIVVYDGATDTSNVVPCTSDAQCAAFPGAACKSSQCATTSSISSIFYVNNFVPTPTSTFRIPCDGKLYTAEIYGGKPGPAGGQLVNEAHISAPFAVPANCALPTVTWTPAVKPSFTFPTIYAGFGPPYDTYSVQVNGLAYPWARSGWSVTSGQPAVGPTAYGAASATFASPGAGATAPISYTGLFHLDGSMLLRTETAASWELQVTQTGPAPMGTGGVPLPP